jgi:hypothetical protein
VRFETFSLPEIAKRGENLIDLDLSPSGLVVALSCHVGWDESRGKTPDYMAVTLNTAAGSSSLGLPFFYPMIRAIGDDRLVVAHSRADPGSLNASVLSLDGTVLSRFHIGDAVEDVLVIGESLVVTYFDEAVEDELGSNGLCVFDLDGAPRLKFHEEFGYGPMFLSDCEASCLGEQSQVWVTESTNFELICLDIERRSAEARALPDVVHGANAMVVTRDDAYFAYMYGESDDVVRVDLKSNATSRVDGSLAGLRRNARGLSGGRFLSAGADSYTVLDLETT